MVIIAKIYDKRWGTVKMRGLGLKGGRTEYLCSRGTVLWRELGGS